MMKVDFAFWNGERFIAIEIDGASHIGNERHIVKNRLLQRSGVQTVHILADELHEYGGTILNLLPFQLVPAKGRFVNPFGDEVPF